jgi:hypothetical protein
VADQFEAWMDETGIKGLLLPKDSGLTDNNFADLNDRRLRY